MSGRSTSPRILPGQPGGFNATCKQPHRHKYSFSELKPWSCFERKLGTDQCICGTILLTRGTFSRSKSFAASQAEGCSLSCRTLHNRMRAVSSHPPFKDFSRRLLCLWLKKQIMFCHPHYEQKNTCFQFRETMPECRHEE